MRPEPIIEVLGVLQKHDVPLQPSVGLICKCQGRKLSDLASGCGYHRNSVYKAPSNSAREQSGMSQAIERELGVNPWNYKPERSCF